MYVYKYLLFIAAEGKWSQRSTEVFFPRDYRRNTGGESPTTGDRGKSSAAIYMNYELSYYSAAADEFT